MKNFLIVILAVIIKNVQVCGKIMELYLTEIL